jgi:putative methionine-R-sulfoxide reductase with GAF domain
VTGRVDEDEDGSMLSRGLQSRWTGATLNAVAVLGAAGAYVFSAEAGDTDGRARTWLLVVGVACVALTVLAGALKQLRDARRIAGAEQVAVDAEEALGTALNGAFAPITGYLGELADASSPTGRAIIAGKIRQAVVDAAVSLTVPGARSAFYRRNRDATQLTRDAYAGRSSLPRYTFTAGTPDGDTVLDLVARGDLVFIEDVEADPMITPSDPGTYRSVIAVAVTAGRQRIGMLTVDAPDVGELTRTDVEMVRVLANLLGSGLAQTG